MAYLDHTYTSGVIAVREKNLLKEKLLRFCELSAEEAFRLLLDSGFGGGAESAVSVYEYEKLLAFDSEELDGFIRTYAPSQAEKEYLLSSNDFHNAKALIKAAYLGESAEKMLTAQGLVEIGVLTDCVGSGDFSALSNRPFLRAACEEATKLLESEPSGAKVGEIFEKALYRHLFAATKGKRVLRKLLTAKADMTNILIALRAGDNEIAKDKYLPCGSLTEQDLAPLFDAEKAKTALQNTPYKAFVTLCLAAKEKGLPLTQAEKTLDGYETDYFAQRKYELKKSEPFLYYVYRRKAENANIRIVFVCLLAGLKEREIVGRLRAI